MGEYSSSCWNRAVYLVLISSRKLLQLTAVVINPRTTTEMKFQTHFERRGDAFSLFRAPLLVKSKP